MAGTVYLNNQIRSDIYDVVRNTWEITGNTNIGRFASKVVALGSRVFALAGWGAPSEMTNTVEEYHYDNKSWTMVPESMIQQRRYFGAISVPAVLFKNIPGGCSGVM